MISVPVLLVGVSLVAALTLTWARRPQVAFPVIVIVGMIHEQGRYSVSLGGVNVYSLDVLAVSITLAAALRILTMRRVPRAVWVWLAILALLAANVAKGTTAFGLTTALNTSREIFYLISVALLTATVLDCRAALRSLTRSWGVGAILAAVAALVFLAQNGLGTFATSGTGERALWSNPTLALAQAALVGLLFPSAKRRFRHWSLLASCGLLLVVLTQQRTVWAATAIALMTVALSRRSYRPASSRVATRARVAVIAVGAALVGLVLAGPRELDASLWTAVNEPSRQGSTLEFRINGWAALLQAIRGSSLADVIFGQPAGTVVYDIYLGQVQAVIPHGMYVLSVFVLGMLGAALFLGALVIAFVKLGRLRRQPNLDRDAGMLWMLLVTQFVYMVGYSLSMSQGIILGLATLIAFDRSSTRLTLPVVDRPFGQASTTKK